MDGIGKPPDTRVSPSARNAVGTSERVRANPRAGRNCSEVRDAVNNVLAEPNDRKVLALRETGDVIVVVSKEIIAAASHSQKPWPLYLHHWSDICVYTVFGPNERKATVQGSVSVWTGKKEPNVCAVGRRGDRVRIVVVTGNGKNEKGASSVARPSSTISAYVARKGQWQRAGLQVVDVDGQLFSRFDGLFETNKLADKKVLVIGLGSGGAPVAVDLCKCAVGHFDLMDHDRFEVGNVVRHFAGMSDIGRLKVEFMEKMIREKNPRAQVRTWREKVSWKTADLVRRLVRENDLVICATDERDSRLVVNKICVQERKPLILAAAFRRAFGGQVLVVRPFDTPCYLCFIMALPQKERAEEISNEKQAKRLAYSDRPVPVEPGLSTDIAPISLMVTKLSIQALLRGKKTTFRSLDEDLIASWFIFLNRREKDTEYEHLGPLGYSLDGLHVLRWYGIKMPRNPGCPVCGDYLRNQQQKMGLTISPEEAAELESAAMVEHVS